MRNLKTVLQESINESAPLTVATGNTYAAKDFLKDAGFTFNTTTKEWVNADFDKKSWEDKQCNPTYNGRGNAKLCAAVKFVERIDNALIV